MYSNTILLVSQVRFRAADSFNGAIWKAVCKGVHLVMFVLLFTQLFAQGNVGIGTSTPDNNAVLDITSTSKGVLFPRLSTVQRDAIPAPIPTSLTIFNTTTNCLEFYVGTTWHPIACPCEQLLDAPAASPATNAGPYSFTANWQSQLGVLGYYLDVATDAGFTNILPGYNNLAVGSLTTFNVTGLNCAATYYYRVRSFDKVCNSENSNTISVYTKAPSGKQVFTYTGADQTFEVPCGITSISVKIWGAGGGGNGGGNTENGGSGGAGGFVSGTYTTTGGTTLTITVGGGGSSNRGGTQGNAGAVAYGGGGRGFQGGPYNSGSGGGRSAISLGSNYIAVAGGGGGGGGWGYSSTLTYRPAGGPGGQTAVAGNGLDGSLTVPSPSAGGTRGSGGGTGGRGSSLAYSGGAGAADGIGGNGNGTGNYRGGGGGGGYFGGGGGGGGAATHVGGGGGGSSFVGGTGFTGTNTPGTVTTRLGSNPPPNNSDTDYVPGVGIGGGANGFNDGGNGLIIISW